MASPTEQTDDISDRASHVQAVADRLLGASQIYGIFLSAITFTRVTRGTVVSRLVLEPKHLNSKGGLHGAVSATIVDFTTGLAIASWDLRDATGASVDMHLSYLSTAKAGDTVEIESKAERVGGSLAVVTIRISKVEADGSLTPVTLGQHTKYVKGTAKSTPAAPSS
ncbi:Acyl-coenzyme A thioesterase 13 [Paramyrothecium foliicola]|nr:Acyl-coenzyme A thioesterase 13 [Paramyrothecium foliicola]